MKKIKVNKEQCIGCGACAGIDGEHFDFDAEGFSEVIKQDNLDSENLKTAIESCPVLAISIVDEAECEKCGCCENCTGEESCDCGCENCECGK